MRASKRSNLYYQFSFARGTGISLSYEEHKRTGLSHFFDAKAVQRFGLRFVRTPSILETFDFDFSRFYAAGIEQSGESSECVDALNPLFISAHAPSQFGHDLSQLMPLDAMENHVSSRSADETRLLPTNCG